jgi:beta-phosphoglucomutase
MLNKQNIRNIILDFDGVIADTESGRFELLSNLLIDYEIDLKKTFKTSDISGKSTDSFLKIYFSQLSNGDLREIVKKRRKLFLDNLDLYLKEIPGAVQTINDLHKSDYNTILATANDCEIGELLLSHLKIEKLFTHKFYKDSIQNQESLEKDYSLVILNSGISPSESLVIEDSSVPLETAKKAGIFCIGFSGYSSQNLSNIADVTISSFGEFRQLIGLN